MRSLAPVIVCVLCFASPSQGRQSASGKASVNTELSKDSQAGQQLFVSLCAGCHGLDARGGEHAPNIATAPDVQRLPTLELMQIVRNGIPAAGMPGFRTSLKDDQLANVVSYLRVLQGKTNAVPVTGSPEAGHAVFFGRAGCSKCHMVAGQGGYFAADLSSYASGHSADDIRKAIVDPDTTSDPRKQTVVVVARDGKKYIGIARNEDNFSIQLQTPDGVLHLFEKSDITSFHYQPRSFMPGVYGSTLSGRELDDLISYLIRTAQNQQATPQGPREF